MSIKTFSRILLNDLRLPLNIGVSELEKSSQQEVIFDIAIEFEQNPPATSSDNIEDTICYDKMIASIRIGINRPVNLIEHTGFLAANIVKDFITQHPLVGAGNITVKVTKLVEAIPELKGGASFLYSTSF